LTIKPINGHNGPINVTPEASGSLLATATPEPASGPTPTAGPTATGSFYSDRSPSATPGSSETIIQGQLTGGPTQDSTGGGVYGGTFVLSTDENGGIYTLQTLTGPVQAS
jgi:hypothetical protein